MAKNSRLDETYDASDDEVGFIDIDHVRRPRITLTHLLKLHHSRTQRNAERKFRRTRIAKIYGNSDEGF